MGNQCSTAAELPIAPLKKESGAVAVNEAPIKMEEVTSELAKDTKMGRRSSELHFLFDDLCSTSPSKRDVGGTREYRKRGSMIEEPGKLYGNASLTEKLTGPWSVIIPEKTVFVGHKIPDTDAICSAIAAAELFEGKPARAGELNTETQYVLNRCGISQPELFSDLVKEGQEEVETICLVDHNQISQVADGVELNKVIGVIDHHAFQSGTICTRFPIYADIRPWGSACTIIAHAFIQHRHPLSKSSAALMLAGIISDTLSLCSPTTTEFDHMMVTFLSYAAGIEDVEELAKEMSIAKSKQLQSMNSYTLIRGDIKKFVTKHEATNTSMKMAIGVVECTDPGVVLERRHELVEELKAYKLEEDVDIAYLIVVDIVALYSEIICPEEDEIDLACRAFQSKVSEDGTIKLEKGRVSRKLDFMPNLVKIIDKGWQKKSVEDAKTRQRRRQSLAEVVVVNGPTGQSLGRGG